MTHFFHIVYLMIMSVATKIKGWSPVTDLSDAQNMHSHCVLIP